MYGHCDKCGKLYGSFGESGPNGVIVYQECSHIMNSFPNAVGSYNDYIIVDIEEFKNKYKTLVHIVRTSIPRKYIWLRLYTQDFKQGVDVRTADIFDLKYQDTSLFDVTLATVVLSAKKEIRLRYEKPLEGPF